MNKIVLLVVNYFNNYIGSFNKAKNKAKYGIGGSLLLIFGLLFVFLFSSMAVTTVETALTYASTATPEEYIEYIQMPLYVSVGMMMMFVILFTVTKATSSKKNNDQELLLSLPFKKSQIVASRILFNYIFDLGMILSTMLPSFIVYFIMIPDKPDLWYFPRFLYLLLIIPLLSNAIGTVLATLFNLITRRFVKGNAIKSLFTIFFLVLFLFGYYALQFSMELSAGSGFALSDVFVLRGIVDYLLGKNWLITGIVISLICFIPFILCVVINALTIGKDIETANSKKKKLSFKKTSITKTLLQQELGKYLNSNVYVMNTLFGGVLLIILSIMLCVLGEQFLISKITALSGNNPLLETILGYMPLIVIALGTFVVSTIAISASSISFEGKNIWIIKVNPVSYKKVFASKVLCNFIVCLICILISSIFFGIRFCLDHGLGGLLYLGSYILITSLFALLISIVGLITNLIFPKLDWQSEAEVVKQSLSGGLGLLFNFIFAVIVILPILIALIAFRWFYVIIPIIISVLILISLIIGALVILNTVGKKLYQKL